MYPIGKRGKDSKEISACKNILRTLLSKRYRSIAWIFYQRVEAHFLGLNDYYDIVKEPMDLTTIRHRLYSNFYHNAIDFARDVRLIFYNTYLYTNPKHLCYEMAKNLQLVFEDMFEQVPIEQMSSELSLYSDSYSSEVDVVSPWTGSILNNNIDCNKSLAQPLSKPQVLQQQPQPVMTPKTSVSIAQMPTSAEEDFDLHIKVQQLDGIMLLNVIHMIQQLEGLNFVYPNKELEFDVRLLKPHTKRSILAYMASKGITGKRVSRPKNPYN